MTQITLFANHVTAEANTYISALTGKEINILTINAENQFGSAQVTIHFETVSKLTEFCKKHTIPLSDKRD